MISRLVVAAFCCLAAGAAQAQAFPSKPIRIVVPYAPGGTTDIVGRQMGQKMSEALGQPVVVENRTGGNTAIGADAVAKSPADGYTLLFTNDATFVLNPVLFPSLNYNVQRDFVSVATVTYVALALAINANTPASTMKELVAFIQARKGQLGYASFGAGSQPHIMGEMFKTLTKTDLVHVPYKGAGPAVSDVLGGQVLFTFPAFPTIQGHLKSGTRLSPLTPEVPTFAEAGFKEMDMGAWYAFLAPAGTPRDVVMKLNGTVNAILRDAAFVEKNMTSQGMVPMVMSPEQMNAMIKSETDRMSIMVKASGAKVE
jgi:tripartite-type tricarboxylate transporter receptor subunit TctC